MSVFKGKWWKPPQGSESCQPDASQDHEIDLEHGDASHLLTGTELESQGLEYPEYLLRDEFRNRRKSPARQLKAYIFTHLRNYALRSVEDKILFLEAKVTAGQALDEEEMSSLISLLHTQRKLYDSFISKWEVKVI
jgi:hypothetical protein